MKPVKRDKNSPPSRPRSSERTIAPLDFSKPGEPPGLFFLYGRRPILEALRLGLVHSIEISRRAHGQTVQIIQRQAEQKHIPMETVEALPSEEGFPIQGVRALARPPLLHHDLRRFLAQLPDSPPPLLLMLDGITDPHNFGAILRTAEAASVSAVIVRERRQASITETVVKSSAGAAYLIPIFEVVNLSQTIHWLTDEGFWSVATVADENAKDFRDYHWNGKNILILGAEGAGISELVRKSADVHVYVPMFGQVESLNVSVAAGILLYETIKKRGLVKS